MKTAVVHLTVNECIAHKNYALGRGDGSTFQAALCAALRDALKHPHFKGRRIRSGKITFAVGGEHRVRRPEVESGAKEDHYDGLE